jgi:hypothetical protein
VRVGSEHVITAGLFRESLIEWCRRPTEPHHAPRWFRQLLSATSELSFGPPERKLTSISSRLCFSPRLVVTFLRNQTAPSLSPPVRGLLLKRCQVWAIEPLRPKFLELVPEMLIAAGGQRLIDHLLDDGFEVAERRDCPPSSHDLYLRRAPSTRASWMADSGMPRACRRLAVASSVVRSGS